MSEDCKDCVHNDTSRWHEPCGSCGNGTFSNFQRKDSSLTKQDYSQVELRALAHSEEKSEEIISPNHIEITIPHARFNMQDAMRRVQEGFINKTLENFRCSTPPVGIDWEVVDDTEAPPRFSIRCKGDNNVLDRKSKKVFKMFSNWDAKELVKFLNKL